MFFVRHTLQETINNFYRYIGYCVHGDPCVWCCWEWKGQRTTCGYGKAYFLGKWKSAHRISVELFHGSLPLPIDSLCVTHRCDNKLCVNPLHLALGTLGDNNRDAQRKGLIPSRKGQKLPRRLEGKYT